MSVPAPIIEIESIAQGGEGVGTLPSGKRIFVPLTVPGDRVEVEILEDRKRFARGKLRRLVKAGPERVEAPCRHAPNCGGCQLQQLSREAQLKVKESAFYGAIERLGGIPRETILDAREIVPSPSPYRYRIRCRLNVQRGALGYLERGSHRLVALEECRLLVPALERLVLAIGSYLEQNPIPHLRALECCVGEDGEGAVSLEPEADAPAGWARKAEGLLSIEGLRGVVALAPQPATHSVSGAGRRAPPQPAPQLPTIFGDPVVRRQAPLVGGLALLGRPDAFAQANAAANVALVQAAVDGLGIQAGDQVLELYCGAGNFSFALAAQGAQLTAVETSGVSLELAQQAARTQGAGSIRFIAGDAAMVAKGFAQEGRRFDRVLLDPPRAGAKGLARSLAALSPKRIAYVSCDPATLARDLASFSALGYRVTQATPIDMFPQTSHVEGVVILEPL